MVNELLQKVLNRKAAELTSRYAMLCRIEQCFKSFAPRDLTALEPRTSCLSSDF